MAYMRYSISDTAEYGDYTRGPKVIDDHVRQNMKQVLQNIRSGAFAREWILENQAGRPSFLALRRQNAEHMIETVGAELRGMMPWLKASNKSSVPTQSPTPQAGTMSAAGTPTPEPAPAAPPPAASSWQSSPSASTPPPAPSPWSSNPSTPSSPSDGENRWGGTQ
jgi:hypothetical protein